MCGVAGDHTHLVQGGSAQVAMAVPCGAGKVMRAQAGASHGILHAPQIVSDHQINMLKVWRQV